MVDGWLAGRERDDDERQMDPQGGMRTGPKGVRPRLRMRWQPGHRDSNQRNKRLVLTALRRQDLPSQQPLALWGDGAGPKDEDGEKSDDGRSIHVGQTERHISMSSLMLCTTGDGFSLRFVDHGFARTIPGKQYTWSEFDTERKYRPFHRRTIRG